MGWQDLVSRLDRACLTAFKPDTAATYHPAEGDAVEIECIFDNGLTSIAVGEAGIVETGPRVFVRLEDLPTDPEVDDGPQITVDGVLYDVIETRPDGQGGAVLRLHKDLG